MKRKTRIFGTICFVLIALFSAIVIMAVRFKEDFFRGISLEELLFYATNNLNGANFAPFTAAIINNILPVLLLTLAFSLPFLIMTNLKISRQLKLDKLPKTRRRAAFIIIFSLPIIVALIYANAKLNIVNFVANRVQANTFFADNYVDPKEVKITFPEKKRNLIYIYLESMENTLLSQTNGGQAEFSLLPELEHTALDTSHVSFSNNDNLGGATFTYGTNWTMGALVAHTSGTPLLFPDSFVDFGQNSFGQLKKFLPGAYSIGEILQKEGYHNVFMIGSDAEFGGRLNFFKEHGDYEIYDYKSTQDEGLIAPDYKVWWGYEDKKLYNFAQNRLSELAKNSQPFNLQLLTVDTHFVDGYLDETCATPYDNKYHNVYACASSQLITFLDWIKEQPFYENTTIVVTGDHLGMQTDYYNSLINESDYERSLYNVFINSVAGGDSTKNRQFSSFDYYPTTLAALGAKIDGERLGLGVNLFSDRPTLFEKYGASHVNQQLSQRQEYYYKHIIGQGN